MSGGGGSGESIILVSYAHSKFELTLDDPTEYTGCHFEGFCYGVVYRRCRDIGAVLLIVDRYSEV